MIFPQTPKETLHHKRMENRRMERTMDARTICTTDFGPVRNRWKNIVKNCEADPEANNHTDRSSPTVGKNKDNIEVGIDEAGRGCLFGPVCVAAVILNDITLNPPPYEIKDNLYGRKGSMHKFFDHDQFAERCNKSKCHHLISYNNSDSIKQRFSKWNAAEFAHTYTMRSSGSYSADQSKRMELVLFNYKLIKNIQLFEDFS